MLLTDLDTARALPAHRSVRCYTAVKYRSRTVIPGEFIESRRTCADAPIGKNRRILLPQESNLINPSQAVS
jgi:hypothetical protein